MHDDRPVSSATITTLKPGAFLGRYELLCVIAQGGMGAVWAARLRAEHGFERKVALKTILPQYAREPRFREMFLDEARLASRIIHSNVVQVLDLAEQDGVLFQAMEWVEGDSLRGLMSLCETEQQRVPAPVAVQIVLDVSKGLHAAHELCDEHGSPLHVVHRDVSPHNIMVGLDGSVRISDFGIAKARNRLSPDTSKGNIKGKLRYMAPEQALGRPLDRRADVWSLAAILYELLSGRPLFDAPNEAALLYEVVSTPPTLMFEEPVHPRLLALLRRAVSRNPEGRHPTAEAFAQELRRAAKESGIEASTEDLATFFQAHLAQRCEVRRKRIEKPIKASSTLPSCKLEPPPTSQSKAGTGQEHAPASSDEAVPAEPSVGPHSLGHPAGSVESRRRRSLVVGSVVLAIVALVFAWFLFTPSEQLRAHRSVDFHPGSFRSLPAAATTASSPASMESAAATASAATGSAATGSAATGSAATGSAATASAATASTKLKGSSRPIKRPPSSQKRPSFADIDDGF